MNLIEERHRALLAGGKIPTLIVFAYGDKALTNGTIAEQTQGALSFTSKGEIKVKSSFIAAYITIEVDFTKYKTLFIEASRNSNGSGTVGYSSKSSVAFGSGYDESKSTTASYKEYSFDISEIKGTMYIKLGSSSDDYVLVKNIWLEP